MGNTRYALQRSVKREEAERKGKRNVRLYLTLKPVQSVLFTVLKLVSKCPFHGLSRIQISCKDLSILLEAGKSHQSVGWLGWNSPLLACTRSPVPQISPPASPPSPFLFPRLLHAYPRAAEQRQMTNNTHTGAMKLEEQVIEEMLVSMSRTSNHHPS